MSEFTERCEKAISELGKMVNATLHPSKVFRLNGKIEGVKLALGYYNETEAAKDARIAKIEQIAEFIVQNKKNFTEYDPDGVKAFYIDKLAAALAGEAQ